MVVSKVTYVRIQYVCRMFDSRKENTRRIFSMQVTKSGGTCGSIYVEPTRSVQDYKQASHTQQSILTRWSTVLALTL